MFYRKAYMLKGILSAVVLIFAMPTLQAQSTRMSKSPQIVGYVFPKDAPLQAGQIEANSLTRINYAFANIRNGHIVTGFAADVQNFAFLNDLKRENTALTVLVSVGGWEWSTNFSDVALTSQSRRAFIDSVMSFLTLYRLDGLDIDWEYPGMTGAGHRFRAEDKQNFTVLLKELRERFDQETKRTGKEFYLTIAAGASDEYLAHTEMAKVAKYVDTVNLMTYDMYEPSDDVVTGHHAPLFTNDADPKKVSANASVLAFESAGVPAAKIILGVPFYGHVWANVADNNHGLFQPGKPSPNGYAPYRLIIQDFINHGYVRYWDPVAKVPYLYSSAASSFVSYEDPESLAAKSSYVLDRKLGGMMFWDYSSDASGALLHAIHTGLYGPSESGAAGK